MLIVLSGLSGVGKTTIARELAMTLSAVHVRIDSIEQALRDAGWSVEAEGYRVAHLVAEDNLRVGRIVIADCVNPWPLTRHEWQAVAHRAGVRALNVEVVCSDAAEHRRRVESRTSDIAGHRVPTWQEVTSATTVHGSSSGSSSTPRDQVSNRASRPSCRRRASSPW